MIDAKSKLKAKISELEREIDKRIDEVNELNREGEWDELCARLYEEIDILEDELSALYG